jgi:hypothetical protein
LPPTPGAPADLDIHSFLIKIWIESVDERGRIQMWRGRVKHIPSEDGIAFQDMDTLTRFILGYLDGPGGGEAGATQRLRSWVSRVLGKER